MQMMVFFEGCYFVEQQVGTVAKVRPEMKKNDDYLHHNTRSTWLKLIKALIAQCGIDMQQSGALDAIMRLEMLDDGNGGTIVSRSTVATLLRDMDNM